MNNFNYDFDRDERQKKVGHFFRGLLRWLIEIAAVVGLAYLIVAFTIEQCNMVNDSMSPTIEQDQVILINKIAFKSKDIERYDLIVYNKGGSEHIFYDIKRVIGLPGETIQIIDGEIYINGEMLLEPMKVDPVELAGFAEEPIILEEDEYFVLGDNRNNSEDSRFSSVGNIHKSEIVGLAWIRFSPFSLINKSNKNYVRPTPTPYGWEPTPTPTPTPKPASDTN